MNRWLFPVCLILSLLGVGFVLWRFGLSLPALLLSLLFLACPVGVAIQTVRLDRQFRRDLEAGRHSAHKDLP